VIGIDTSFIVAYEIAEHAKHAAARLFASERHAEGFAVAAQVLTEFCHVVTDPRRFKRPLSMQEAVRTSRRWWRGREVTVADSGESAGERFLNFIGTHRLGRNRLPDTMLAATYLAAGVHVIVTLDARDFGRFAEFAPIVV